MARRVQRAPTTLSSRRNLSEPSNTLAWSIRNRGERVKRTVGSVLVRASELEDRLLQKQYGVVEQLGFSLTWKEDGTSLIADGRKAKYFAFDIDHLPWAYQEYVNEGKHFERSLPDKNRNYLVKLLRGRSLKTVDVFSKPSRTAASEVQRKIDAIIANSRRLGRSTPRWEEELRDLAVFIESTRIDHFRCGVANAEDLDEEFIANFYSGRRLAAMEIGRLVYGILNGFWDTQSWDQMQEMVYQTVSEAFENGRWSRTWEANFLRSFVGQRCLPDIMHRQSWGVLIEPSGMEELDKRGVTVLQLPGLGFSIQPLDEEHPEAGEFKVLNGQNHLTSLLPFEIEEEGDSIILVTTYTQSDQPDRLDKAEVELQRDYRLRAEEARERALAAKWEKNQKENKSKAPAQLLDNVERSYLDAFSDAEDIIFDSKDLRVRCRYTLMVQSPNPQRSYDLAEAIAQTLRKNGVLSRFVTKRRDQLLAVRSALPLVQRLEKIDAVSPMPLREVLVSLVPDKVERIAPGRLMIPIGITLPLHDLYQWPFGDPFGIWARQRTGKTSLLELLIGRLHGLLPHATAQKPGSVMWIYDGTNADEPAVPVDWGWPSIANYLNEGALKSDGLPKHLAQAVVYAENYMGLDKEHAAGQLRDDLLGLVDAGARLVVYRAYERVHQRNALEFGFFEAVSETRRRLHSYEIPSVFFIDEIQRLVSDKRVDEVFIKHLDGSTKASEFFGVTGHTKKYLPEDTPWSHENIRQAARANLQRTVLGPTNLHRDIMEEAEIDPNLFPEESRYLARRISSISLASDPGTFVSVEGGGGRIQPFRAVTANEFYSRLLRRKSVEAAKEYGV